MSGDAKMPRLSFDDVEKCFECPICFNIPDSIYQCEKGHCLCSSCHSKMFNCPQCEVPLGNIRCLFAEHLLEKFLPACPFAKHGCTAKLSPSTGDLHEKYCPFREVDCPACNKKVSLRFILRTRLIFSSPKVISYSLW